MKKFVFNYWGHMRRNAFDWIWFVCV